MSVFENLSFQNVLALRTVLVIMNVTFCLTSNLINKAHCTSSTKKVHLKHVNIFRDAQTKLKL